MKYNFLGNTGLVVSEICFGTMTFGGGNGGIWEATGKLQQQEVNDLMKLVQQLPQTYRSVFNLYAIEGYSHQEIGTKLGITELLSRTTLYRARNILKEKLAQLTSIEQLGLAV